jgi:lysophospholipase L1-like esterase
VRPRQLAATLNAKGKQGVIMRVHIIGDSIVQGFYDAAGGWVQRLANDMHMKTLKNLTQKNGFYAEVFNLGISGDTAEGVAERISTEIAARQIYDDTDVIIVAVGINNAILQNNVAFQDVYDFQETYDKIITKALKITDRVICVGLTAVDETYTNPLPQSSSKKQYLNHRINLFEDTIKQCAQHHHVPFIALHDDFLSAIEHGAAYLADGIHPNTAGHEYLYRTIHNHLQY